MSENMELIELRQKYYGLFVQLLWKEPSLEFLKSLKKGIKERIKVTSHMSPSMAEGWSRIEKYLEEKNK